ncbi:helix-turn-helix domain-containing protein [Rossellomorea aquimaris]|jgi:excisionase family DNA binding protein|uniref:helix-turn-helix domain-containing protein n=1 Tax=Rossellomorea aquimaris TaxID=189382 RepID=UPI0011E97EDF|nr:helix-turn-helix domain-containing protein [Rossellomorea aquimaris]TYS91946.1 helix-turn-helix domain-containing protein [Rossellomorea aquimaris]
MAKRKEDYPLVLTAKDIQEILGVGKRKSYEIMEEKGFPIVRLGGKLKRVNRDDFFEWLDCKAEREIS